MRVCSCDQCGLVYDFDKVHLLDPKATKAWEPDRWYCQYCKKTNTVIQPTELEEIKYDQE